MKLFPKTAWPPTSVSLGGMLLGFFDLVNDPMLKEMWFPYLCAFIASFGMSYIALKWFMGIMARGNLKYFSYYCFIAGTLILLFM